MLKYSELKEVNFDRFRKQEEEELWENQKAYIWRRRRGVVL